MTSNYLELVFHAGLGVKNQMRFVDAFKHFTNALDIYVKTGYNNLYLLSEIFWQRADVAILLGYYVIASKDIGEAMKANPRECCHPFEANKWLDHATMCSDPGTALNCCSAALHFANRDESLQSLIYGCRAMLFHEGDQHKERDKDIEKCKKLDFEVAKEKGKHLKDKGIEYFHSKEYHSCMKTLQLAEIYFMQFENQNSASMEQNKHLHDCLNFMASSAWNLKKYEEALQAGKRCYELRSTKNKIEVSRWRLKGNEILKQCNYELAVECYSLAIKYATLDDVELLGILHSNRSSAYFRMKKYCKAKEDAEKSLKYRPKWSKLFDNALTILTPANINRFCNEMCGVLLKEQYMQVLCLAFNMIEITSSEKSLTNSGNLTVQMMLMHAEQELLTKEYSRQQALSYHRLGSALFEMHQHDYAVDVLKDGLIIDQSFDERYQIFNKITEIVFRCKDGPKKINFPLPRECMVKYLKECMARKDWVKLELLFLGGGGQRCYVEGKGGLATGCNVNEISLVDLIKSKKKGTSFQKLLPVLIDHGACVNGTGKQSPLSVAVDEKDYETAVVLLKKKADVNGLLQSKYSRADDTPAHTAFRIGLSTGSWDIFNFMMRNRENCSGESHERSDIVDNKGNSLFHLVAAAETTHNSCKAVELLKNYNFNPTTKNKSGQTPLNMLRRKKDVRYRLIEEIGKEFTSQSQKKKKNKKKKNKYSFVESLHEENKLSSKEIELESVKQNRKRDSNQYRGKEENVNSSNELDKICNKIANVIDSIVVDYSDSNLDQNDKEVLPSESPALRKVQDNENPLTKRTLVDDELCEDKRPLHSRDVNEQDSRRQPEDHHSNVGEDSSESLDGLTWEVECTCDFWKILTNDNLSRATKKHVVDAVRKLAEGHMYDHLAIPLKGLPNRSNIVLYEARVEEKVQILWERAIAFSPRCSNNPELLKNEETFGEIYSDVIRLWDIVFNPETLAKKIANVVRSHERGVSSIIKKYLQSFHFNFSQSTHENLVSIPKLYIRRDDASLSNSVVFARSNDELTQFFPPGSPEETEYHILKFYSFSNSLVNAVLDDRREINVDFPFRVSELEHAVINLKSKPMSSLLLLGRSGTGKTTCCLYRLWFNFQSYWERHIIEEPGIPKLAEFIPKEREGNSTNNDENGDENGDEDGGKAERNNEDRSQSQSSAPQKPNSNNSIDHDNVVLCSQTTCDEDFENAEKELTYEHLHQVFITKNGVLCTEVQRNFQDLSQACPATLSHSEYERTSTVNKFDQLEEQAWPLFICSRDWLLMLDASLPEPAFFPRNNDGELVRSVKGWGEDDNHLQEIPEENAEDEDDNDIDDDEENEEEQDDLRTSRGSDLRLEVTYQVFKNEIWPKMTKKRKVHYHPTLVWTEIRSFIKGSVEALHSRDGYITLEEYQILGRKRAPCFSADRETVYDLFLAYQRVKRSKGMFDEADLVHDIYHRLQDYVPEWSIHEIYVDETQDFTQAELSVIIRCCRDPNRLFFTGDTAQSIMRGIAFRFNDLKSLFYYMKESYKAVGQQAQVCVPDRVYQLTHNYRSHAGILNLASSVIDLLLHFFPESFDRMERDQGLFNGPKPVLLDSCSFTDLAVILRGHKRKTSPIEFGAHQVVLVPSEEVRDSLPQELKLALVMTIYEAKGLEFDDVLLYNFFKESQAHKEWRVVSSYKSQDAVNIVSKTSGIAEILDDNLETKTRPLKFDPDHHKILISEFKYLYTALTRARVNVWLFDEDEEARAPMFEYFIKRAVVEVKRPQKTDDDKVSLEGMFAEKSGKEEWGSQGHFFYGKALWKVACQCFTMAEDELMKMKCHAQMQAVEAASLRNEPRKLRMEFLKAGELFLQCGMKDEAAICLHNARAWLLLAKLYQTLGKVFDAAKLFRREGKFLEASENFEKGLDFRSAVDCLLKSKSYNQALEVIARCRKLVEEKVAMVSVPRVDQREESICYQAAEYYLKHGQLDLMTSALEKLPEIKDRITFLQKNACYDQAAELLLKEGKPQEAAELMRSNGKFLEATSFTDDDKFAADCYLLATRSTILSKAITVNTMDNGETQELIEAPLHRAAELYERCGDVNGQAEVKFTLGKFLGCISDLEEAGKLYCEAYNYAGMAECFLMVVNMEKESKTFTHQKATNTSSKLFYLILALHKKNLENIDRIVTSMCERHFGLLDTGKTYTRKVPQLEMVRISRLETAEMIKKEEISLTDAYNVIKKHLYKMAVNFIQRLFLEEQTVNELNKPCSRYIAAASCDEDSCKCYHGDLTRQHFADRFYALCLLIHLDAMVSTFLNKLKQESLEADHHLTQSLLLPHQFKACAWLKELLFPSRGQLGQLYSSTESDLCFLRQNQSIRHRIIEYAKFLWCDHEEEDRWSDSDLFITVSNLMHVAAAPVPEIFNLLSVEERKFEKHVAEGNTCTDSYGFFSDGKTRGRYVIFSRWLEHSKNYLYNHGDVLEASHSAIKIFLYTPARRSTMPYPSIANAVMILEYYMTACLMLYSRFVTNNTSFCLPASYLTMIQSWDIVNKSKANQKSLSNAIKHIELPSKQKGVIQLLERLLKLNDAMVMLMFGGISTRYNIFTSALCDRTVNWGEAERALVLALTMLCNCGRGIPKSCEILIRQQLPKVQSCGHLPSKLKQCIEAVQQSQGMFDVVIALQQLLDEKPQQENLLDVYWDEELGATAQRDCMPESYPRHFNAEPDGAEILDNLVQSYDVLESWDAPHKYFVHDFQQTFIEEDGAHNQSFEDYESEKQQDMACIVIQKAFRAWMERKRQKEEEIVKNDPVENRFRMFKLDKSGCNICGCIQFESHTFDVSRTDISSPPSNWKPRILKRNTYNSHSSPESPHWKMEEHFKEFKEFYRTEVFPFLKKAQELDVEMKLKGKGSGFMLDVDRLEQAITKLQSALKHVENERLWHQRRFVYDAVQEVDKKMKAFELLKVNNRSSDTRSQLNSNNGADKSNEESSEEKDYEDDEEVGSLKEISSNGKEKSKKKAKKKKKKRRK